ncbi:hypothetical protein HK102_000692, partial [Quaeritorhiza haematococci]
MTAHDYSSGLFVDRADIDVCLIGDSLAMVALGHDGTNEVTLDEMIHHARAVSRGCRSALRIGDLPFGTYESTPTQALDSAIRYVREGNVDAVKLEGGKFVCEQVAKIVQSGGIPVMGHIGLTPQRQAMLGGYKVQGKTVDKARSLLEEALELQDAGVFSIVLEAIPEPVATFITKQLSIPTIGIGAGPNTSGQVLVQMDALGAFDKFLPRFCKLYASLGTSAIEALSQYREEVKARKFPEIGTHTYGMESPEEEEALKEWMADVESRKGVATTGPNITTSSKKNINKPKDNIPTTDPSAFPSTAPFENEIVGNRLSYDEYATSESSGFSGEE